MMEWSPIETATEDRRVLLWRPTARGAARMVFGKFDDDRHAKKPRPYWTHDLERLLGVSEARANKPSLWADPEPPQD